MSERKKSIVRLFAAAVLLFVVSAYRQLSMRYLPEDFLRPYLVWAVYMFLLFSWQHTITTKITQKTMRTHLTGQNIVSILYLSGCFPLCQYSMDALYRILYQYRGCLHTTVRVLQRILSRQAGGLPDQQKVVSAPNPGMFSEHAGTNQRFASLFLLHCAGGTPAKFVFPSIHRHIYDSHMGA